MCPFLTINQCSDSYLPQWETVCFMSLLIKSSLASHRGRQLILDTILWKLKAKVILHRLCINSGWLNEGFACRKAMIPPENGRLRKKTKFSGPELESIVKSFHSHSLSMFLKILWHFLTFLQLKVMSRANLTSYSSRMWNMICNFVNTNEVSKMTFFFW